MGGLFVLAFVLALIATTLNLTIRLAPKIRADTACSSPFRGYRWLRRHAASIYHVSAGFMGGCIGWLYGYPYGAGSRGLVEGSAEIRRSTKRSFGSGAVLAWVPLGLVSFAVLIARATALNCSRGFISPRLPLGHAVCPPHWWGECRQLHPLSLYGPCI